MSMEIDRPRVEIADFSGDVNYIDEHKLKAVFENCYASISRAKKFRISLFCSEGNDIKQILAGVEASLSDIDFIDIEKEMKERIKFYLNMWDYILEKKEAEIYLRAKIKVAPKNISDRELLAEAIAREVLKDRVVKTFLIENGNRHIELGIYCYQSGYYSDCEEELKGIIERLITGYSAQEIKLTSWIVKEALEKIKRRTQETWRPARHKILFKDRVFDWDTFIETGDLKSSLIEPSPELYVEHRIPWSVNIKLWDSNRINLERYIPPSTVNDIIEIFKTISPKSHAAFSAWVKKEGESDEETNHKVVLLLEIIGYTLYPHDYPFHKAVLLVGSGSNGKSTYINLVRTILGNGNIASINLKDLDSRFNRFAASELFGKLANISTEPVRGVEIDMTQFKQLTGEDPVRFERKFRDGFVGQNYAKMIFAANELPRVTEDTYAFWRRWLVIEFPNQFPPKPKFFEETFTPEEIEGIIICALYAFRLVMLREGFTTTGTKDPREEWMARSNPVYRVMKKMLEEGLIELRPDGWIVKKDLYELYKAVVNKLNEEEDDDLEVVGKKRFTEELEKLFPIKSSEARLMGRHNRIYRGVSIRDWSKAKGLVGELETPETSLDIWE